MTLLAVGATGAFAGCAQAFAAAMAQGNVNIDVQQSVAGIAIVSPLVLPTVSTTAVVASSSLTTTTVTTPWIGSSSASAPLSNATLTVYGQSGDAMSMTVPESFKVVRAGGTESLTVKTNTKSQYGLAGNGVVAGDAAGFESLSVNVGGSLVMASADQLAPGAYEGVLVVMVQYN